MQLSNFYNGLLIFITRMMQTIQTTASSLWLAASPIKQPSNFNFLAHAEPQFLLLLAFEPNQSDAASMASALLRIALEEQACTSVQGLAGESLWEFAALATCVSPCHVYLNVDLLTIDANAQDWGDFKIKPEQVEVQRNELTHAALFNPLMGFVLQVSKEALPTLMDMLRTASLAKHSSTIGKTWGSVASGYAVLDIYRDAKKQASFSALDLIALKNPAAVQ
jgi:hypothetical protein